MTDDVTTDPSAARPGRPRFSAVVDVIDSAGLADFIASVAEQSFPLAEVEIIAVHSGGDEESRALLDAWAAEHPDLVTVVVNERPGQRAGRDVGLTRVTAPWVTFPDPADKWGREFLTQVGVFLDESPECALAGTNRYVVDAATGKGSNNHSMRFLFAGGTRLVDISRSPEFFWTSAAAGFFRTQVIRENGLQFGILARPVIDDVVFCAQYLLACERPLVGFLQHSRYYQTVTPRAGTPARVRSLQEAPKLDDPVYTELLTMSPGPTGLAPEWIQNVVLFDISLTLTVDVATSSGEAGLSGESAAAYLERLRGAAERLSPTVVEGFGLRRFERVWRDLLLHGLSGERWVTPYAVLQDYDAERGLVLVVYRYTGEAPTEEFLLYGAPVQPVFGKVRAREYFEEVIFSERHAWLPADGTVRVVLDGEPVELRKTWPGRAPTAVRPATITEWFGARARPQRRRRRRRRRRPFADAAALRLARSRLVRRRFGNAWVLMDRVDDADDNGERLFQYLRAHRPDINAWFVVEKDTADWRRIRGTHRDRLVAYGSFTWRLLMLNCVHVASSHLYVPVRRPVAIARLKEPTWKFTFLQHGVIKDDLSRWLDTKAIDLFITSTPGEQQSIAGDGTPYRYTERESRMTGLARFDRLRELGGRVPVEKRDLILVCPTWRNWLNVPLVTGEHRRVVTSDIFDSEYIQTWTAFLASPALRDLVEKHGMRVGFLPHPNIQPILAQLSLPEHIQPLTYAGQDIQQLIASSAVMVTDYSSTAFNAAYIERPVIYFQFDAERMLRGGHTSRAGYFEYERDGFGPVVETVDDALASLAGIVESGKLPAPEYLRRMVETFPERDGRCCERVVAVMEEISREHLEPRVRHTPYYVARKSAGRVKWGLIRRVKAARRRRQRAG